MLIDSLILIVGMFGLGLISRRLSLLTDSAADLRELFIGKLLAAGAAR